MSRDEFLQFLARSVADGLLTEADAVDLLRQFDAGTLEMSQGLPLTPAQTNQGDALASALTVLAALALSGDRAREALRDRYEVDVQVYAERLAAGAITLAEWQAAMGMAVRTHLYAQALAGGDRTLTPEEGAAIEAEAALQMAYLSRFADGVAVALLLGVVVTVGYLVNRAIQYAGAGWAWWFRASEREGQRGVVVDYVARDDDRTCGPCLEAEDGGPYLPGTGPMPGQVCRGRGRCRCVRVERVDLAAWRRLTGN